MFVLLEQPAHVERQRGLLWQAAREWYALAEGALAAVELEDDEDRRVVAEIDHEDYLADGDMYTTWALAIAEEWLPQY